jgi:hypothetical protein
MSLHLCLSRAAGKSHICPTTSACQPGINLHLFCVFVHLLLQRCFLRRCRLNGSQREGPNEIPQELLKLIRDESSRVAVAVRVMYSQSFAAGRSYSSASIPPNPQSSAADWCYSKALHRQMKRKAALV